MSLEHRMGLDRVPNSDACTANGSHLAISVEAQVLHPHNRQHTTTVCVAACCEWLGVNDMLAKPHCQCDRKRWVHYAACGLSNRLKSARTCSSHNTLLASLNQIVPSQVTKERPSVKLCAHARGMWPTVQMCRSTCLQQAAAVSCRLTITTPPMPSALAASQPVHKKCLTPYMPKQAGHWLAQRQRV